MKKKLAVILLLVVASAAGVFAWFQWNKPMLSASGKPLDPKVAALFRIEEEIKKLNDQQVIAEIDRIMSIVNKPELIDKLNRNLISDKEKKEARELLTRLALPNVEKTKRHIEK